MMDRLVRVEFPIKYDEENDLVVGYANKAVVDLGNDLIPAEAWFDALETFFREGMPVKLLHRPKLVVGETVWLKVVHDGLKLASRPLYPEVKGLIERGLLRGYSVGFYPRDVEVRPDGVTVIRKLDLVEISYVDEPMNQESLFESFGRKFMLREEHEVTFDPKQGIVVISGLSPEEMGKLAQLIGSALEDEGYKSTDVRTIVFKMADAGPDDRDGGGTDEKAEEEIPESVKAEIEARVAKGMDPEQAEFDLALEIYYKELDGEEVPEEKAKWSRRYINRLPDAAFAVIEPAYLRGETKNKNCRHLPHHNKNVKDPNENSTVDLPHYRNALARVSRIKPVTDSISREELIRRARRHLEVHRGVLKKLWDVLREIFGMKKEESVENKELTQVAEDEVKQEKQTQEVSEPTQEEGKQPASEPTQEQDQNTTETPELAEIKEKVRAIPERFNALEGKVAALEQTMNQVIEILKQLAPQPTSLKVNGLDEEREEKFSWGLFSKK